MDTMTGSGLEPAKIPAGHDGVDKRLSLLSGGPGHQHLCGYLLRCVAVGIHLMSLSCFFVFKVGRAIPPCSLWVRNK